VADRLRDLDHDVEAAADDALLRALPDDELLRHAAGSDRAVVTENARDFDRLIRTWAAAGEHHRGVVFTSPRRFHRGSSAYPQNLITALSAILGNPPSETTDWVHWL